MSLSSIITIKKESRLLDRVADKGSTKEFKNSSNKRKEDALALAQLIYDIYQEEGNGKIEDGQNNAQENEN